MKQIYTSIHVLNFPFPQNQLRYHNNYSFSIKISVTENSIHTFLTLLCVFELSYTQFNAHTVHYQTYWKKLTICTDFNTHLFYVLAPTCFGSSLPSSGSLLDPPELLEIQIGWVVYHTTCGYVTCVPGCRGFLEQHWSTVFLYWRHVVFCEVRPEHLYIKVS
jgi:hypothetical protein